MKKLIIGILIAILVVGPINIWVNLIIDRKYVNWSAELLIVMGIITLMAWIIAYGCYFFEFILSRKYDQDHVDDKTHYIKEKESPRLNSNRLNSIIVIILTLGICGLLYSCSSKSGRRAPQMKSAETRNGMNMVHKETMYSDYEINIIDNDNILIFDGNRLVGKLTFDSSAFSLLLLEDNL